MNNWFEIQSSLAKMTLTKRKQIFKHFVTVHPNWKSHTVKALSQVVVYLDRQVDVCNELELKKQALNRSVRHYRYFVTKFKYCKKDKHENKHTMDTR
jgi:hypothetical protein